MPAKSMPPRLDHVTCTEMLLGILRSYGLTLGDFIMTALDHGMPFSQSTTESLKHFIQGCTKENHPINVVHALYNHPYACPSHRYEPSYLPVKTHIKFRHSLVKSGSVSNMERSTKSGGVRHELNLCVGSLVTEAYGKSDGVSESSRSYIGDGRRLCVKHRGFSQNVNGKKRGQKLIS